MSLLGLAVLAAVTIIALVLLIVLNVVVSKSIRREGYCKYTRFEAGNPPIDIVKKKLVMQYFGFIFLLVVLECAFLYVAVLSLGGLSVGLVLLLIIVSVVYALTIMFLYRYIADLREWA